MLAADVRVYKCISNRNEYHVLHLQHALPGEDPRYTLHLPPSGCGRDVYWRQFRPEFVAAYPLPLSPDAHRGITDGKTDANEHDKRVSEATVLLIHSVIPEFAKELSAIGVGEDAAEITDPVPHVTNMTMAEVHDSTTYKFNAVPTSVTPLNEVVMTQLYAFDLTAAMHRRGISVRHLGALRSMFWSRLPRPCRVDFRSKELRFDCVGKVPEYIRDTSLAPSQSTSLSLPNPYYDVALDLWPGCAVRIDGAEIRLSALDDSELGPTVATLACPYEGISCETVAWVGQVARSANSSEVGAV